MGLGLNNDERKASMAAADPRCPQALDGSVRLVRHHLSVSRAAMTFLTGNPRMLFAHALVAHGATIFFVLGRHPLGFGYRASAPPWGARPRRHARMMGSQQSPDKVNLKARLTLSVISVNLIRAADLANEITIEQGTSPLILQANPHRLYKLRLSLP
jgi:hypothetical protein